MLLMTMGSGSIDHHSESPLASPHPSSLSSLGMEKFEENAAKSRFPINVADAELIIQLSLSTIVRDADISFSV